MEAVEWTQKTIDVLTGPLPVAAVLGRICLVLWAKLEERDKTIAALQEARIGDLKAMLKQDD